MRSPLVALCCLVVLGAAGAVRAQSLGTDVLVGSSGGTTAVASASCATIATPVR